LWRTIVSKHLTDEEMALYVDAMRLERTRELPGRIEHHVSGCEHCKKEMLSLLELTDELPYNREEPHPYFDRVVRQRPVLWGRAWRVAAVLAGAIGIGVIWNALAPFQGEAPPAPRVSLHADSATSEPPASAAGPGMHDLASRFEPSPNLEDLVGMPLRSVSPASSLPPSGAVVKNPVRLTWQVAIPGPYAVSVLDNTDRVVFDTTLALSRVSVLERLGPGLYYWKIVAGGRLQLVSKFVVREP
jgi:hypothetical protein